MPDKEELHFFDDEELFGKEISYEKLHEHFQPSSRAVVAGELTPIYLYWRPVMERIWNYRKGREAHHSAARSNRARFFALEHATRARARDARFSRCDQSGRGAPAKVAPLQSRRFSYVARGLYAEQLERVFQFFPRYLVKVVRHEDLRNHFADTINSIFGFIGVDSSRTIRNKERNPIPYEREMTAEERREIYPLFEKDIVELEKLLDWNCSDWKSLIVR